jgi:hypothetical protein
MFTIIENFFTHASLQGILVLRRSTLITYEKAVKKVAQIQISVRPSKRADARDGAAAPTLSEGVLTSEVPFPLLFRAGANLSAGHVGLNKNCLRMSRYGEGNADYRSWRSLARDNSEHKCLN